jgi:hypothetical protein
MKRPEIKQAVFQPGMDREINTMLLREIFKIMGVKHVIDGDSFTAQPEWEVWGVRIEDKHDEGEATPHYILTVGEGNYFTCKAKRYFVRYCDYHSTELGDIETAPGTWTITLWLPYPSFFDELGCYSELEKIAQAISDAYEEAMIKALPDYEILASRVIPEVKSC